MLYLLKKLSFSKNFFTFVSATSCSSKIFYMFAVTRNLNFAVNQSDVIFPPKQLKLKNKKHRIFCKTTFHHPTKFELKRIKNAKVVQRMHFFVSYMPTVFKKIVSQLFPFAFLQNPFDLSIITDRFRFVTHNLLSKLLMFVTSLNPEKRHAPHPCRHSLTIYPFSHKG